jgi:hypothetical protein
MRYGLNIQNDKILIEFTDFTNRTLSEEIISFCNSEGMPNEYRMNEMMLDNFERTFRETEIFLSHHPNIQNSWPVCILSNYEKESYLLILGIDNLSLELINYNPENPENSVLNRIPVRFFKLKDHGVLLSVLNELVRRVTKNNNGQTIFTENLIRVIQELSTERHVRNYLY